MKLTKFEKARIIGARALQISMGAPSLIKAEDTTEPMILAIRELEEGVIPITVMRSKPLKKDLGE